MVVIPAGTFKLAKPIWLKRGVSLEGVGIGKTILESTDEGFYLLQAKGVDAGGATITNLTLKSSERILLMYRVSRLTFRRVEFLGGMARFESCSEITLEENVFSHTSGKAAYASSKCDRVRIVGNDFHSTVEGSLNLSGHTKSYVAWNRISAPAPIVSGYAGIRLPNRAMDNVVEDNVIENHGRGIFILSSSERNVIRRNVVRTTTEQGIFVQSSHNTIEGNTVIDAGKQAIYLINADAKSSPTPSISKGNRVCLNRVYDTRPHEGKNFVGLQISAKDNVVTENAVSQKYGREYKAGKGDAGNEGRDNSTPPEVEVFDFEDWARRRAAKLGQ